VFEQGSGGLDFQQKIMVVRQFPSPGSQNGDLSTIDIGGDDILDRESKIFGGIIKSICLRSGSGSCSQITNGDVFVSFRRPYTEPLITSETPGCSDTVTDIRSNITYYNVCDGQTMQIEIEGNDANSQRIRTIIIEPTGNIYTRNN